jgi:hypothetical protein
VVTTPVYPAIMSMLVFLKNLVLRALDQSLRADASLVDELNEMYTQSVSKAVLVLTSK